jgi:hypothetical protein
MHTPPWQLSGLSVLDLHGDYSDVTRSGFYEKFGDVGCQLENYRRKSLQWLTL